MPKFLALASYTSEGIKGLTKAGGLRVALSSRKC